jgi:hypothetical protein
MANEPQPERRESADVVTIVLVSCGIAGLILIGTGIGLFIYYSAWTPLITWLREGTRDSLWKVALSFGCVFVGTLVTVIGLQWARQYERTDPVLRRIIYGFNVYVQMQLLCWVLAIVNLGIGIFFPNFLDTTEGSFYSLSEKTQEYIAQLDRPVQIFVVMPEGSETYLNARTMLEQMHDLNPKYFNFEEVSPSLNRGRIAELTKEFPTFTDLGLIVKYGEGKETYSFIPATELENQEFDFSSGRQKQRQFNGEVRLMQELYYLSGGKKKPVIYFTQGYGEPDLFAGDQYGMGNIRQKLTQANYQLRPLSFADQQTKVPDDADVVVVVGPKRPMVNSVPALKEYMDGPTRKGKLVVLIGPTPAGEGPGNQMRQVGLEDWLRTNWNVDITNEQILTFALPTAQGWVLDRSFPRVLLTPTDEAIAAHHPLAQNFQNQLIPWYFVREVKPQPGKPTLHADAVLGSVGRVWTETDMKVKQQETFIQLAQNPDLQKQRVKQDSLPVVVTVAESSTDPHSSARSDRGQTPRLVVIGCSDMVTNQFNPSDTEVDFLRGAIDWCRERYSDIGIQPKTHQNYTLPRTVKLSRLLFLPALVMVLAIGGLGLVVWNIRRR